MPAPKGRFAYARVVSIGIDERGSPVMRIVVNALVRYVPINHSSFAMLAAEGVAVINKVEAA